MENERARLTKKLADIYESQGKTKDAAEILQELQVNQFISFAYYSFLFLGRNLWHHGSSRKTGIFTRTNAFMFSKTRLYSHANYLEKDQYKSF